MSRYGVNKLMRRVAQDPDTIREFKEHAERVMRDYELSDSERSALQSLDYATLYASGAHPQLLVRFIMALWPGDRRALGASYSSTVARYGRPDFSS